MAITEKVVTFLYFLDVIYLSVCAGNGSKEQNIGTQCGPIASDTITTKDEIISGNTQNCQKPKQLEISSQTIEIKPETSWTSHPTPFVRSSVHHVLS